MSCRAKAWFGDARMALPMIAAYDSSGFTVEYGPAGRTKGRLSSSGGLVLIGPGDDTRLTMGGGLDRGVAGRDDLIFCRAGVLGMG